MGQYVLLGREGRASGRNGDSRYDLHICNMGIYLTPILHTDSLRPPRPKPGPAGSCWQTPPPSFLARRVLPPPPSLERGAPCVRHPCAPLQCLSASPHTVATATQTASTQAAIASHRCSQTHLTSVSLPVEAPLTLSHGAQNSHILSLEVNASDHTGWKPVNPCSPSSLGGSSDMHVPRLPERSHGVKLSHPYQRPAP